MVIKTLITGIALIICFPFPVSSFTGIEAGIKMNTSRMYTNFESTDPEVFSFMDGVSKNLAPGLLIGGKVNQKVSLWGDFSWRILIYKYYLTMPEQSLSIERQAVKYGFFSGGLTARYEVFNNPEGKYTIEALSGLALTYYGKSDPSGYLSIFQIDDDDSGPASVWKLDGFQNTRKGTLVFVPVGIGLRTHTFRDNIVTVDLIYEHAFKDFFKGNAVLSSQATGSNYEISYTGNPSYFGGTIGYLFKLYRDKETD